MNRAQHNCGQWGPDILATCFFELRKFWESRFVLILPPIRNLFALFLFLVWNMSLKTFFAYNEFVEICSGRNPYRIRLKSAESGTYESSESSGPRIDLLC